MTIAYADGRRIQAILLSRSMDRLRAAVTGDEELRSFILSNNTWISERGEPVTIEFDWQQQPQEGTPTESECICSKRLARRLIAELLKPTTDVLEQQLIYVFARKGHRMAVAQSELQTH